MRRPYYLSPGHLRAPRPAIKEPRPWDLCLQLQGLREYLYANYRVLFSTEFTGWLFRRGSETAEHKKSCSTSRNRMRRTLYLVDPSCRSEHYADC